MFDVPEGVSIADFQSHPVRQMIRAAAYSGRKAMPSRHELDALELSPTIRKRVLDACREVADIHATGMQSDAWDRGDKRAVEIVGDLPEEQRDPKWFGRPAPEEFETDPAALAARVPRVQGLKS